ncbi:MAG: ExbD/TolR family protein [bacterium]
MLRKMKRRIQIRIDMTPMVDVIILLLIFFFMTSTFREPEAIEVNLPSAFAGVKIPKSGVYSIITSKDGTIYADNELVESRKDFIDKIVEARAKNPALIYIVKCDQGAEYGVMLTIMDDMRRAGIVRFSLSINKEAGAW